jgi:pyroglutamyl-peptidase
VPAPARRQAPARTLRVLLTGFEPFGGECVNPAERLVRTLVRGAPPHARVQLAAAIVPVDRARYRACLDGAVRRHRPHVLLAVGQATGRPALDLETQARNRLDYRGERDNGGHAAGGEPLHDGGPDRLRASLPLRALHAELRRRGLPVRLSVDAGRHLCNALLYHVLLRHPGLAAGFVHVPLLPEQAARRGRGEPALAEPVSRRCLEGLIRGLGDRLARPRPERRRAVPGPPAACRPRRSLPSVALAAPRRRRGRPARRSAVPPGSRAGGSPVPRPSARGAD